MSVLKKIKKLSTQEITVLELIQKGFKNKEISNTMGLNEKTVSTYLLRVKRKLGVPNNRNSHFLVRRAIELGIVKPISETDQS